MKILSTAQTRAADQYTISHEPVSSVDLMERAAGKCTDWIAARYGNENPVAVFCGNGNNGGDGLAIARLLHERKYNVSVYVVRPSAKDSADFSVNLERLKKCGVVATELAKENDISALKSDHRIVIDAVF
ncbi:MAG TPA: NAD(P)H-hydrate epimerase, partial [Bacteroidia bacterium]|nr:NAD(P)H-hydrate epimerase [Bacteroidia bacterium]